MGRLSRLEYRFPDFETTIPRGGSSKSWMLNGTRRLLEHLQTFPNPERRRRIEEVLEHRTRHVDPDVRFCRQFEPVVFAPCRSTQQDQIESLKPQDVRLATTSSRQLIR